MKVTIKAMRVNAGLTQHEAAKALGVTSKTLVGWERHKRFPNAQQLANMADLYNCELSDFLIPSSLTKNEG